MDTHVLRCNLQDILQVVPSSAAKDPQVIAAIIVMMGLNDVADAIYKLPAGIDGIRILSDNYEAASSICSGLSEIASFLEGR